MNERVQFFFPGSCKENLHYAYIFVALTFLKEVCELLMNQRAGLVALALCLYPKQFIPL